MSTITASHTFVSDPFAGPSPFIVDEPRRGLSRRSFLAAISAVSVVTVSGCGVGGSDPQDIDGGSGHGKSAGGVGSGGTTYAPVAPFALTAACELSEDYFVVQNHQIDPAHDKVAAYTRTNGQVEAMILQDGVVKQVYHDPTQAGGWAVYTLPGAEGVTDMVAAATTPTGNAPYLLVCYTKAKDPGQLYVATQPTTDLVRGEPSFTTKVVGWESRALDLQVSLVSSDLAFNDDVLVWAMVPSSRPGSGDGSAFFQTGFRDSGEMFGVDYDPAADGRPCLTMAPGVSGNAAPTLFLYVPQAGNPIRIWCKNGTADVQSLQDAFPYLALPQPPDGGFVTTVEYATPQSSRQMPTALVWTQSAAGAGGHPQLWVLTCDDDDWKWVWTSLGLPQNLPHGVEIPVTTGLTPRSSRSGGYVLDVFVTWDETLSVARQIEQDPDADVRTPLFTPMIPLQRDVHTMTSQAGATPGNQLLMVATDGTLHTLEKDPDGGWSDNKVLLPASQAQQNSSYRVALTLADAAWNAPVTAQDLTIVASTPTVAVVEGSNPRTVQLSTTPTVLTTDSSGEVQLALLADGLSAPTLTVTSTGLSKAINVCPSEPLNTYMQGGATLNYLPAMDVKTLVSATTPDGQTVAPDAGKDTGETARQIANMKQAADLGAQGVASGTAPAPLGRVDGGRTRGTRHRRIEHAKAPTAKALGSSIDNWAHDVFHAIKKGATNVRSVAIDTGTKTAHIAVDAAGWADKEIQVVVHDIEDAAHVLHAAFNKLGADIVHAVKWLEAEVIGVFTSAKRLSDHFETWIQGFSQFASRTLAADKTRVVTWLQKEQQLTHDKLDQLADRFPAKTSLSNMAKNPPGPLTGSSRRPTRPQSRKALLGSDDDQQPTHGDWFYNKIKHELARSGLKFDLSNSPDVQDKLTAFNNTSKKGSSTDFRSAFTDNFWKGFITDVVTKPDDVNGISVHALLHTLVSIVDKAFAFAEDIVDAAFDLLQAIVTNIPALLSGTTLKDLPILGALMRLIGLGDVSIGRVANLIFAFPAALVYKIAHGAHAEPFASGTPAGPRGGTLGDVAGDLQICAASVMGTWAVFDTLSAAFVAGGDDGGLLFNAIDIAAPLIVTILTTPATQDGQPFFTPPVSGDVADVMGFLAWIFGAIPAACAALPLVIEKFFVKDQGAKDMLQATVWFQSLTGVLALVFGMVGNSQKPEPKGADYAGAVLNNMPTISGAGLSDILIESTVGVSVVVAMALTLICGGLGAGVYGALG